MDLDEMKEMLPLNAVVKVPGVSDPEDPDYLAMVRHYRPETGEVYIANLNQPFQGTTAEWVPIEDLEIYYPDEEGID